MIGRTVLVTGATSGIGLATATGLAGLGARVGIVGRNSERAAAAAELIRNHHSDAVVGIFVADLSAQTQVRRLADAVLAAYPRLHVLVNNGGGFWAHRHVTTDGLEQTFAVNHLAPFLLTNLLLDRLVASVPARIVTVSSNAHSTRPHASSSHVEHITGAYFTTTSRRQAPHLLPRHRRPTLAPEYRSRRAITPSGHAVPRSEVSSSPFGDRTRHQV